MQWRLAGLLVLSTITAWGAPQVIFRAEDKCQPNPLANLWQCQSVASDVATARPSSTNDPMLKAVGYTSFLDVIFRCQSSTPIAVTYRLGEVSASLAQTASATVQRLSAPVPYEGGTFRFAVSPSPAAIVLPGCSLAVHGNLTLPNIEGLEAYTRLIVKAIDDKARAASALDSAATLPAKWTVIRELETTLSLSIALKEMQLAQSQADPAAADALSLEIDNLKLLKNQVAQAMPANDPCSGLTPGEPVFCLSKVSHAKTAIDAELTREVAAARAVLEFLRLEAERVADVAEDVRDELQELAASLFTVTGG